MEQYERLQVLGRGSFGLALLVRERGSGRRGHLRVIKEIDLIRMHASARDEAHAEAGVLRSLSHINIIAHYSTFIESSKLHIVMEFADGGDLAGAIKQRRNEGGCFNQDEALSIFMQCCLALQHVHLHHVLHRDLKCPNIFLTKAKVVKLGDFGIAKVLENTAGKAMTMIGTPSYLPPEVVDNKPYGIKADIWSLGVVLYELLVLEPPFQGNCLAALVLKIVTTEPKPVPVTNYSEEVRRVVTWCLQKSPDKRPSTDELLDLPTLRHGIGLLPSVVIEHIRACPSPKPATLPVDGALDVTRLPPGRQPFSAEAQPLELAGGQVPLVQRPRRRSAPRVSSAPKVHQVLTVVGEDAFNHELPLQRRCQASDDNHSGDHHQTPRAKSSDKSSDQSRNSTRAPTPEANLVLQQGAGVAAANFAGGDAVDAFLLNRHANPMVRPNGAGREMFQRDRQNHAMAGVQRATPRSARSDASHRKDAVADFFPNYDIARPLRARGEAEIQGRVWSPDYNLGNAVSSTPRKVGLSCERVPSSREAKTGQQKAGQTKDEFPLAGAHGEVAALRVDGPPVGLAGVAPLQFHLKQSPRGVQLHAHGHGKVSAQDEFPSMSEIVLPATPMNVDLAIGQMPGAPPKGSPRGPLGIGEGRREGPRKPRSSIGLAGAGMVGGGLGVAVAGAEPRPGHRLPGDDVSSQAAGSSIDEGKSSARQCHSPRAAQGIGFSGNELQDISNLFGNTFARELMVYPAAERWEPLSNSSAQEEKDEDDIANLFGETFAREELIYRADERPEPCPISGGRVFDDTLESELAKLCKTPDKILDDSVAHFTSRPESQLDFVDDDEDASDSWHAAKALTEDLEFTLTTPFSMMPYAQAAL